MVALVVLFWMIISSDCVHGQDQLFQAMYNAVDWAFHDLSDKIVEPLEVYDTKIQKLIGTVNAATFVTLQNTSTNLYILDICGRLNLVTDLIVGFQLSDFLLLQNYFPILFQQVNEIDTFVTRCNDMVSFGYNISLVDSENGTIIQTVTTDKWSGTTLASLFPESTPQFNQVKKIGLHEFPITELTVSDLMHFPELETLILFDMPISWMEDGLLCHYTSTRILMYRYSFGYLTTFPQQIFNCSAQLKLEFFKLHNHNIAYLPANAFGSKVNQLKAISLRDIGLEVIHEDAFKGLINVQFLLIKDNKLSQMSDTVLLPFSQTLRIVKISDYYYSGVLNFTAMGIARYSQLKTFSLVSTYVSNVSGNLCSNHSHSKLEIVTIFDNMINMLPSDIFDHCVSLKWLFIGQEGLLHLPETLFATNVSQLETLFLEGNKLNSSTSWSDVLMPLHELKILILSANMLTSWTFNLSSLWKLEILDLSHNAISKISHTAFTNRTNLKFLLLHDNNLAFLTNEVQGLFIHIASVHLGSNNISQLNMSGDIFTSDTSILNVSSNNLIHLNLPLMKKCTQPCGKISLFGDKNVLLQFTLPCSKTQLYRTVSLTNNQLSDFQSMFPDVLVQQCSIEILNVSGNNFLFWGIHNRDTAINNLQNRLANRQTLSHSINTLDMTRCGITYIEALAFELFTIDFLYLRENSIYAILTYASVAYPISWAFGLIRYSVHVICNG